MGTAIVIIVIVLGALYKIGDSENKKKQGKSSKEEITSESSWEDMKKRWDKNFAEAESEIAQHRDIKADEPVIASNNQEDISQLKEIPESDDPKYHDFWMSHEWTVFRFLSDYTVIDIETTGFDRFNDKIVEISAIRVRNHEVVDQFDGFNKKSKLSKFLKDNSAITQEDIDNGQSIEELLRGFKGFVGNDVLVGHNIGFDLTFLRYNLHYYEFGDLTNGFTDTMLIGKYYANPDWSHHRVDDYIANYPKEVGFDDLTQHTALNDTLIEQRIYEVERDMLGDDFDGEITSDMLWAMPKVRVVEEEWEITTRVNAKKMVDAIRVAIDDKNYTYSNQLIEELFEAGVTDHSKLYKRMAMNYKKMGDDNSVLSTIVKWQSNMGGNIGKGDSKWIQNQLERINHVITLNRK